VATVWIGHQPQSVLQIVAAGDPGRDTGGGLGAKFWARAGPAAASIRTAAKTTRSMIYYRPMRRPLLTLAALLTLAVAAHAAPAAPGFRIKTTDGRAIDSNELIGKKIVVLRFQASYCKPCVKESAALSKLAERYRDRGVEIIAIHVQDTAADTRRFIDTTRATYPVAMDPRLNLGNRFGFKGTPYTVVIDKKGEMVVRLHGESAVSRLPRMLDALLKRDQP
jgi:peroxiredoxin